MAQSIARIIKMSLHMIRSLMFFGAACLLAGSACAQSSPAPMSRHTLVHDGLEREYFVFLPSAYDGETPLPAVVFMHGYGGTATGTEAETTNGLTRYAEEYGYVMVFPQSTWFMSDDDPDARWEVSSWNHLHGDFARRDAGPLCTAEAERYPCPPECGDCDRCGWASCNDDVGFLRKLVGEVSSAWRIDTARRYVAGFSNGAQMANRFGCEASDLLAGIALIGGRVEPGLECTPSRSLPLLQVNGGADTTVPHDGSVSPAGFYYASTTAITKHWTDGTACAAQPESWTSSVIPPGAATCAIACGDTPAPAIDCLWPEGDHRWPGTPGFRGSNGYCVTELQAASMPEQTLCIAPDTGLDPWGSRLLFEFFEAAARER